MRQLMFIKPGSLEWREVPEPQLQGSKEAIVRPMVVARCDLDAAIYYGKAPFTGPFPFGHEFVAEIVSLGEDVHGFHIGQQVVVPFQISCGECARCRRGLTASCTSVPQRSMYGLGGMGGEWGGALSDLVRVPFAQGMLLPVPDGIDPSAIASASDNLPDAWRTVGPYLQEWPGADVLIVGGGACSIGLYAAAMARALGAAKVDYIDGDPRRLALAESVGANAIQGPPPKRLGPYPITVDASAHPTGLTCALKSVEPGGVCTSVSIYYSETTPMPLLDMYATGMTFKTGLTNARTVIPKVLELVQSGRFRPEQLTTRVAPWHEAAEAFADLSAKVVVVRNLN